MYVKVLKARVHDLSQQLCEIQVTMKFWRAIIDNSNSSYAWLPHRLHRLCQIYSMQKVGRTFQDMYGIIIDIDAFDLLPLIN